MKNVSKCWREAATMIVLGKNSKKAFENGYNYKVLVFKRTEKTSFMPNSVVFPGGAVDQTDEKTNWTKLFNQSGLSAEQLRELEVVQDKRPPIFQNNHDESDALSRNISLRLTAIRETFEELGLLLCRPLNDNSFESNFGRCFQDLDIPKLQNEVHDHETTFLDVCWKHQIVPDILNCFEWSDWITPTTFKTKRFETAFYLSALANQPDVFPEKHEVADYMWETPAKLIEAYQNETIWLPPPQLYELSRLSTMNDIDEIVKFAKARNQLGTVAICPVQYRCKDGLVHAMPGDDLYPLGENYATPVHNMDEHLEKTRAELRAIAKNLHRAEFMSFHEVQFYINIKPSNGQLNPLIATSSKL